MTNTELANLFEEAARRLRAAEAIQPAPRKSIKNRETVAQFALRIGKSEDTIQAMCRKGLLVARQIRRGWQIDAEASERALSLKCGNAAERDLAKRR